MSNSKFLFSEPLFAAFAGVAMVAEKRAGWQSNRALINWNC